MKKKIVTSLIALLVIVGGVFLILDAAGVLRITLFRGWWTLFLIVPALLSLFSNRPNGGNLFLLGLGVILLLNANGVLNGMKIWLLVVGLAVVCIGLSLLFHPHPKKSAIRTGEEERYMAIFSGTEAKNISQNFRGADCTAIFGSIELDLQEIVMEKDATVSVTSVFGGVEVVVPPHVSVKVTGTPIFGGIEDKTSPGADIGPTLFFNCTTVFGGVEILEHKKKR